MDKDPAIISKWVTNKNNEGGDLRNHTFQLPQQIFTKTAIEPGHQFDELKKRWDANEAELVNAFKILGYGKE